MGLVWEMFQFARLFNLNSYGRLIAGGETEKLPADHKRLVIL